MGLFTRNKEKVEEESDSSSGGEGVSSVHSSMSSEDDESDESNDDSTDKEDEGDAEDEEKSSEEENEDEVALRKLMQVEGEEDDDISQLTDDRTQQWEKEIVEEARQRAGRQRGRPGRENEADRMGSAEEMEEETEFKAVVRLQASFRRIKGKQETVKLVIAMVSKRWNEDENW